MPSVFTNMLLTKRRMKSSDLTQKEKIEALTFTFAALHYQGRNICSIMRESILWLHDNYEQSGIVELKELAQLEVCAYLNMGFPFPKELLLNGWISEEELCGYVREFNLGKRVKITRAQIRSMIGKWSASRLTEMTVNQVVDDIIEKVSNEEEGIWRYAYRKGTNAGGMKEERYELIIHEEEKFFWDLNRFRFFVFEKKGRDNYEVQNSNLG